MDRLDRAGDEDLDARQRQQRQRDARRVRRIATARRLRLRHAHARRAAQTIGVAPESIDGCLITHEHDDHVKGAAAAAKRWGWGIYATPGTARARALRTNAGPHVRAGHDARLSAHDGRGHGDARTTRTSRSASSSRVEAPARAPDCSTTSATSRARIAKACESLDILVLESNHDDEMLRYGPYPPFLQTRIASRVGHLSNPRSRRGSRATMVTRDLKHLVLAHLSEEMQHAGRRARRRCARAMAARGFKGTITAAKQDAVVGPFVPGATRAEKPTPVRAVLATRCYPGSGGPGQLVYRRSIALLGMETG